MTWPPRPSRLLLSALLMLVLLIPSLAAAGPATPAARQGLAVLDGIARTLRSTRYVHSARVDERKGIYDWDCSLMVTWVLRRTAPLAQRSLWSGRPVARDYYQAIARAPLTGDHRGWTRLAGPADVRPGDLFAWLKPPMFARRNNTGHVGFVVGQPTRHPRHADVWVMRVTDASSFLHDADTRPEGGGHGTGTMAFRFDAKGKGIAYGWYGAPQPLDTYVPTTIVFGRVHR